MPQARRYRAAPLKWSPTLNPLATSPKPSKNWSRVSMPIWMSSFCLASQAQARPIPWQRSLVNANVQPSLWRIIRRSPRSCMASLRRFFPITRSNTLSVITIIISPKPMWQRAIPLLKKTARLMTTSTRCVCPPHVRYLSDVMPSLLPQYRAFMVWATLKAI